MSYGKAVSLLAVFLLGVALGCGSKKSAEVSAEGDRPSKADDTTKPIPKDDLPAAEAKLAALEKAIAAKKKELDGLETEADALRRSIAAAKAPKDKVYRTADGMFADMPREAYPKFGPQGGVEGAAARKWLKEKFVPGQVVEWEVVVKEVVDKGEGPFSVTVYPDVYALSCE